MSRQLISREFLRSQGKIHEFVYDPAKSVITDEAREYARSRGIILQSTELNPRQQKDRLSVAIGADHGGYRLKEFLRQHLEQAGYRVLDVGTHDENTVDYPDYAQKVAREVGSGRVSRGIMIDAIGVASAMVCNRVSGVRAAACQMEDAVISARRHNDANVLTIGSRVLNDQDAVSMVDRFLREPFDGGRHLPRVRKIMRLDRSDQ